MKKTRTTKQNPMVRIIPLELEFESESNDENTRSPDIGKEEENMRKLQIDDDTEDCTSDTTDALENQDDINTEQIIIPPRTLPPYNVPEKIIIIYDRAQDEEYTSFELSNGKRYTPAYMLKHGLKFFLQNKVVLNGLHEFALMTLNESTVTWAHDFTRNVQNIIDVLEDCSECVAEDQFNITPVFNMINQQISLCIPHEDTIVPPPYIVRCIFFYSRSYTVPVLQEGPAIKELLSSPYFTFDVCMNHEPPSSSNHSEKIAQILQSIDKKGLAYFFSVHRSALKLHEAMAKLLAHPLQRPYQSNTKYSIKLQTNL